MIVEMIEESHVLHVDIPEVKVGDLVPVAKTEVSQRFGHISKVFAFEEYIKELPPVETPIRHYFSKGVYAREMFIPKGTVITGHIHKYMNLNIMSMGELSILTEEGVIRVKAPFTVVSKPGTKRLVYAHEDTLWTTIHGTDKTDVDEIEEEFIAHSLEDYAAFVSALERN